jgi:hypothetical protein
VRECLFLVRNGIPFDVAFEVDDVTRAGWAIIFSEQDGARFNFGTMEFEESK